MYTKYVYLLILAKKLGKSFKYFHNYLLSTHEQNSYVNNDATWVITNAIKYGTETQVCRLMICVSRCCNIYSYTILVEFRQQVMRLLESYDLIKFLCNTLLIYDDLQVSLIRDLHLRAFEYVYEVVNNCIWLFRD